MSDGKEQTWRVSLYGLERIVGAAVGAVFVAVVPVVIIMPGWS
jgi:hypothetical protein